MLRMDQETAPTPELVTDVFARACPSRATFEDVTSKWASLVLIALGEGPYRFGELRRKVQGVSEKMLSQSLRSLERNGMVTRTAQGTVPPRVDYELTALGAKVSQNMRALADVLEGAVPEVVHARERYGHDA